MGRVLGRLWRRSIRPFEAASHDAGAEPTSTEILDICRRLLRHPLPDDQIQRTLSHDQAVSGGMDYEDIWRRRLKLMTRVIEEGEIQLPRVLAEVARRVAGEPDLTMQTAGYVALNKKLQLPLLAGTSAHRGMVTDLVVGVCTSRTAAVLDLGSGWGEHLANVWLAGGPREARYYACEPSEYGRKCAVVLGALDRSLQLSTAHFDYRAPQLDFLPRQNSIVAYSVHSIEQVEQLAPDLIPRLCSLADDVTVAHVEPIGWQMIPSAEWNDVTARHARRCRKKQYNQNLWALLTRAEAEGLIAIDHAWPNFFGLAYNPASIVVWHKR